MGGVVKENVSTLRLSMCHIFNAQVPAEHRTSECRNNLEGIHALETEKGYEIVYFFIIFAQVSSGCVSNRACFPCYLQAFGS